MDYESCPKCGILFDPSNFWKLTAACGHLICRHCALISNDGCDQCELPKTEKLFVCHCGKAYKLLSSLSRHKHFHKTNIGREGIRGRSFADFLAVQNHAKLDNEGKKSSFVCKYCNKRCSHISGLHRHLMTHINEYPFKCSICGNGYKLKFILVKHITKKHKEPKFVADKLAIDASMEYLEANMKDESLEGIHPSIIHSLVMSTAIKKGNFLPDAEGNKVIVMGSQNTDSMPFSSFSFGSLSPPSQSVDSVEASSGRRVEDNEIEVVTLD